MPSMCTLFQFLILRIGLCHIPHWIFTDAFLLHCSEVMVPLMLEEEDHQLGGGGVEAEEEEEEEEEVLQGLLHCSMCRNDH